MADGGSITLRMSLQGAEQVKAELNQLGPAGSKMARELDRAMRQPGPGLQALDAGVRQARHGVDELAGRAGPLGAGLSTLGGVGLALAATLGVVVIAAIALSNALGDATRSAADLADTAARIGTSATELQQWRYVADEAGVSIQSLEGNLEKLTGVIGAFKLGIGDAKLRPVFEELGITQAQLSEVDDATDVMMLLADTLGQVQDRASQVKLARSLGVEDALPVLRLGSAEIRRLSDEASNLGFVLSEEANKSLDETDRQLERAGQQMKVIRDTAVAPLAAAFADATGYVAGLAVEFSQIEARAPRWVQWLTAITRALPGTGAFQRVQEMVIARIAPDMASGGGGVDEDDPALLRQRMALAGQGGRGGFELRGHTGGGGGGGGQTQAQRDAARRRQEAEREIERIRAEELRADLDRLRRQIRDGATAEDRGRAAQLLAESERAQEALIAQQQRRAIEDAGLWTEEVGLRQQNLAGLRDTARDDAERARLRQEEKDRLEALAAAEDQHLQITGELLSLASAGARTSSERQEIELQLLALSQRRHRADLEAAIAAEKEPAARARLVEALERLPALFDAQAHDVRQRTAGPLGQWRDGQMQSAGEANEWLQGAALNALDGLNGGLIDAFRNAENAGDALERMGRAGVDALGAIADALLKVAIQRLMIEPLTNALFGGATGSGGGGLLGNFLGSFAGNLFGGASPAKLPATQRKGFGRGGVNGAAGWAPVGEYGMEFMDLPVGARIRDADATQRTLLDFDARMRTMAADDGARRAPVVNVPISVVNRTGEAVTARQQQAPDGSIELILEPLVRRAVGNMGADGSLARAHRLTPPITSR